MKTNINILKEKLTLIELITQSNDASFIEKLKNKAKELISSSNGDSDEYIINSIKEAVNEINLVKQGKSQSRPASALLDEL